MPRTEDYFVMVTVTQMAKLIELGSPCVGPYLDPAAGKLPSPRPPFVLPTEKRPRRGMSPEICADPYRLERGGLISMVRNPPKPPTIAVLLCHRRHSRPLQNPSTVPPAAE